MNSTAAARGSSSTSNPAGRAYSTPPDLLAGLRGPTSKGRGWEERDGEGRGGRKRGRGGKETGEWKGMGRDARRRGGRGRRKKRRGGRGRKE